MKITWFAAAFGAVLFAASTAEAQAPVCFGSGEVASPDGQISVRITRQGRSTCGESRVETFSADGHMLSLADYTSSDGQSGEGVVQAEWSPDSQFLAYSLSPPANRPGGHYTMAVYSRKQNKVKLLPAGKPEFTFTADALEMVGGDGKPVRMPLAAQ
ncbi:MAG TPA: hypothetical protein VKP60_12415 [Magnetospirillaceae bacterium]|nr:hypothetical protein [Magnetospirillaceae bacterium]